MRSFFIIILLSVSTTAFAQKSDTLTIKLNEIRQAKLAVAWQAFQKIKAELQAAQINDKYDENELLYFKEIDFLTFKIVPKKK